MMIPTKNEIIAIIIVVLIAIGSLIGAYYKGASDSSGKQAIAQLNHNKKVKNNDAKIAKSVPYNGNGFAVDNFLLTHTSE